MSDENTTPSPIGGELEFSLEEFAAVSGRPLRGADGKFTKAEAKPEPSAETPKAEATPDDQAKPAGKLAEKPQDESEEGKKTEGTKAEEAKPKDEKKSGTTDNTTAN